MSDLTGYELRDAVTTMALRDWKVSYIEGEKCWHVYNAIGEFVSTYPEHWSEDSIRDVLTGLFWDCTTKADIALQLTVEEWELHLSQNLTYDHWEAHYVKAGQGRYGSKATTPAEAICKAYIALMAYVKEQA